jgi:hypothetical protein
MRTRQTSLCLLALACAACLPASARRILPYRAVVEVTADPKVGEASWRGELAARITDRLRAKGCLAGVEDPGGTTADLRVHVRVEDLRRETDFGTSLAQSVSPDASPDVKDLRTARLRATLLVELIRIPAEERIEQRRMAVDVRRSPHALGEDVDAAAAEEAMEQAADRAATVVCRAKAPR